MDARQGPDSFEDLRCRVCGWQLDEPPWGADGRTPTFDYCSCCGVEFGYQDANADGARRFRRSWLATGGEFAEKDVAPPDWDRDAQLTRLPPSFK
jgi:hypothetical protein